MSTPFGSRTTLQAEERIWQAINDYDWIGPSQPAPQRLALDTPDEIEGQKPHGDDGLGPATGVIVALALTVGIIGGLCAAWTIAAEIGVI